MASTYNTINLPSGEVVAKSYTNFSAFPVGTSDGELAIDKSANQLYYWDVDTNNWVSLVGASAGADYKPQNVLTITGTDISNKFILLASAPTEKQKTRLSVVGGIEQEYSIDFVVTTDNSDRRLSWDGLGLESILEVGDRLIITYN